MQWKPKKGDWVVSLKDAPPFRKMGEVFQVKRHSDGSCIYYLDSSSIHGETNGNITTFRKAEPHEIPKSKVHVFNDIYVGDIAVCINVTDKTVTTRKVGDLFKVLDKSETGRLYYDLYCASSLVKDWRKATPEEEKAYYEGVRNINDMKKTSEFQIGKWYKSNYTTKSDKYWYYIKVTGYGKYQVNGERIYKDSDTNKFVYEKDDYWNSPGSIKQALELGPLTDLSEIQQYLPDGHPDKKEGIDANQLVPRVISTPTLEKDKWYEYQFDKYFYQFKNTNVKDSRVSCSKYLYKYNNNKVEVINRSSNYLTDISRDIKPVTDFSLIYEHFPEERPVTLSLKTKEEHLLEEAKKRYPVGTKFKAFNQHIMSSKLDYSVIDNEIIPEIFPYYAGDKTYMDAIWMKCNNGANSAVVYYNGKWAEIVEPSEQMTREELLEECAKRYKKGDVILEAEFGDEVTILNTNFCYTNNPESVHVYTTEGKEGRLTYNDVYRKGKWAPILKREQVVESKPVSIKITCQKSKSEVELWIEKAKSKYKTVSDLAKAINWGLNYDIFRALPGNNSREKAQLLWNEWYPNQIIETSNNIFSKDLLEEMKRFAEQYPLVPEEASLWKVKSKKDGRMDTSVNKIQSVSINLVKPKKVIYF